MNIGIDISPLIDNRSGSHKFRGSGFYLQHLKDALLEFFPQYTYQFFTDEKQFLKTPDIIHIPYFEPYFLTLPFFKKSKLIVTVHDMIPLLFPNHFPSGYKGRMKWLIQKKLLHSADAIITDSKASQKDIATIANISEQKIYTIPLAAGEEFTTVKLTVKEKEELSKKYNLPDEFVLYVGDVTWNKNLPNLVSACLKYNLSLVLVGKSLVQENFDAQNPWNHDLIKVNELISSNPLIKKLGFVPTEDLVKIYNMATVFAMPSFYEGFGLPILEAMNCGCPVITTKEGSLSEVAGDAAYFVDPLDFDSIGKGLEKVYKSAVLQKELKEKGLLHAKKFSWKNTASETIKVYEKTYH